MSDGLMMLDRAQEPETSFAGARSPTGGLLAAGALGMPDTSGPGPTALQEPARWVYDFDPATGQSRATFSGLVSFTEGGSESSGVSSFNGRSGAVVLEAADLEDAGALANPSPSLTGTPTAPTASPGDSSTQIATTAFVGQAIAAGAGVTSFNGRQGAVTLTTGDVTAAGGAPSASPALTGAPTTPTASQGDASSTIASTQFVSNALASGAVLSFNGRRGAVALTLSDVESVGGAPISSPTFTGVPSVPTAAPGSATTQAASTAFVTNAITAGTAGVSSVNTRTGAVVLNASDLVGMGGAPLNSPVLTGNPAAPTPSAGDNSTRIATTAYVETAIGGLPPGVATFNGRQGTVTLQLSDVTSVGGAPLASPTFTGSPLTTTPAPGDNSTRIADTAFVAASFAPLASPTFTGTVTIPAGASIAGFAPLASPTFTGTVTIPAGASIAGYLPLSGGTLTGPLDGTSAAFSGSVQSTGAGGFFANAVYPYYGSDNSFVMYGNAGARSLQWTTNYSHFLNLANSGQYLSNPSGTLSFNNDGSLTLAQANAFKPGGGAWGSTSDERTKRNIAAYGAGLKEVVGLAPISFEYNGMGGTPDDGVTYYGLSAQATRPIMPELVIEMDKPERRGVALDGKPIERDEGTLPGQLGMDVSPLMFALVNCIKELVERIEALEAKAA